jgi:hypothetical protein
MITSDENQVLTSFKELFVDLEEMFTISSSVTGERANDHKPDLV